MAMPENAQQAAQSANEQLAQIREQLQTLSDRVGPALSNARDTAQQYASQARDTAQQYAQQAKDIYEDQTEMLSERVRESPIVAILIAAGVGYLLGRIAR